KAAVADPVHEGRWLTPLDMWRARDTGPAFFAPLFLVEVTRALGRVRAIHERALLGRVILVGLASVLEQHAQARHERLRVSLAGLRASKRAVVPGHRFDC